MTHALMDSAGACGLVAAVKVVVGVVEDTNLVSGDAPVELQSRLEVYRTAHQSMTLLTSLLTMG